MDSAKLVNLKSRLDNAIDERRRLGGFDANAVDILLALEAGRVAIAHALRVAEMIDSDIYASFPGFLGKPNDTKAPDKKPRPNPAAPSKRGPSKMAKRPRKR